MRGPKRRRTAVLLMAAGAAMVTLAVARRGSAQTMYPYIWGISNMGETCGGWCHGGPRGGQYLCCGVIT